MIADAFKKGPAFIAYLTAGDGGIEYSEKAALALIAGGVDLLEIGIPFSDPVADGPTIQRAMTRSLQAGTTPQHVLELVQRVRRETNIPIVLFSYYNPMLRAGEDFLQKAKECGASGILIVDLPLEEAQTGPLEQVFIVTPSTSEARLKSIAEKSQGFIYYACQKGTTGARKGLPEDFSKNVQRIKKNTQLPVAVGFGIADRSSAAEALQHADGFIVGSHFVEAIGKQVSPSELTRLAQQIDPRRKTGEKNDLTTR
jgi:tryptophan synthase alpha chain